MNIFIKKISLLIISIVVIANLLSHASLWALRQSNFYKPSFLVNSVKQEKLDYIILGASNGITTLNTNVIDSMLLTEGINLSMDDTAVSSQYLMLQHFLAEGKRAKYCILASSPFSLDAKGKSISNNDYRFLMYVNRGYVSNYYKQFTSKSAYLLNYSKWMPALGMSYYNAELFYPSLISLLKPNKRNRFDERGNYGYPFVNTNDENITNFQPVEIEFSNDFLKKIKTLCEANGIQLICYISPIKTKKVVVNSSLYKVINHSNALLNTKYFHDEIHVNSLGRQASSINFAKAFSIFAKTLE